MATPAKDKDQGTAAKPATEPKAETAEAPEAQDDGTEAAPFSPYPDYSELDIAELRTMAKDKGVGIPADVEKAQLVAHLRKVAAEGEDVPAENTADVPSYDLMTVEALRGLVPSGTKAFTEAEERGYLVGQLRAVASGPAAAQSAQVGGNRPAESLPADSGVSDKDRGRS